MIVSHTLSIFRHICDFYHIHALKAKSKSKNAKKGRAEALPFLLYFYWQMDLGKNFSFAPRWRSYLRRVGEPEKLCPNTAALANGFGKEFFALRPDGAVTCVEREQTENYTQIQQPKIIRQDRNALYPEQDISDRRGTLLQGEL